MPETCHPVHPGQEIRRRYTGLKTPVNMAQFAKKLGISRYRLKRVMAGLAPVEPDLATRLARIVRGSRASWMRRQADYDLWEAARQEALRKRRRARRKETPDVPLVILVMSGRDAGERAGRGRVGRIHR